MFAWQPFQSSPLSLSIVSNDDEMAREDNQLDYLPFGVKTLKVCVAGDYEGKLCLAAVRPSQNRDEKFAHEDGDGPPQFVVSWGGGHEDYYELDYPKKRLVHFLVWHVGHVLDVYSLTIQARSQDRDEILAQLTVKLTCPMIDGIACLPEDILKPAWREVCQGAEGGSDIFFAGRYAPDYISRWWPSNQVVYDTSAAYPPLIRLRYRRWAGEDGGDLNVYATDAPEREEVILAQIQGRIPYPLYDMQQVVPELYRFGPHTWALRVWFFWLDKEISLDDLKFYGTRSVDEIRDAWRGIHTIGEGGLAAQSWCESHEIPDAERVDIIFDDDLKPLFAATDLHWRELWGRYERPDPPVMVRIMNTRPAALAKEWRELGEVIDGWVKVSLSQLAPWMPADAPYNPQLEVARQLFGPRTLAADPLSMESHTPAIMNLSMQMRLVSSDVTDG